MVCTHVSRRKTRNGLHGRLRQKRKDGYYHYRLTIANGTRKEFTLRPANYDEAIQKASNLDSIWLAPTQEVALAQMNAIRGFSTQAQKITFEEAWEKYQIHPGSNGNESNAERKTCKDTAFPNQRHGNGLTLGKESGASPIPG